MARKKTPPPPPPVAPPPTGEIYCATPEAAVKAEEKIALRQKEHPDWPSPRIIKGWEKEN